MIDVVILNLTSMHLDMLNRNISSRTFLGWALNTTRTPPPSDGSRTVSCSLVLSLSLSHQKSGTLYCWVPQELLWGEILGVAHLQRKPAKR